jgi:hypothetical protein
MADIIVPGAQPAEAAPKSPHVSPSPVDEEEILDWDFYIEDNPSRPTYTIQVRLVREERSKPDPIEDPDEDWIATT